jgi:hypothetical protein
MAKVISYDGGYPNLCAGELVVEHKGQEYTLHSLVSGGSVSFDGDWIEHVTTGRWGVHSWPTELQDDSAAQAEIIEAINNKVPYGCCGGCV